MFLLIVSFAEEEIKRLKMYRRSQESRAREQLVELENRIEELQGHRAELLREVRELKSNSTAMEREMDQLTEENGDFSVQVINKRLEDVDDEA